MLHRFRFRIGASRQMRELAIFMPKVVPSGKSLVRNLSKLSEPDTKLIARDNRSIFVQYRALLSTVGADQSGGKGFHGYLYLSLVAEIPHISRRIGRVHVPDCANQISRYPYRYFRHHRDT